MCFSYGMQRLLPQKGKSENVFLPILMSIFLSSLLSTLSLHVLQSAIEIKLLLSFILYLKHTKFLKDALTTKINIAETNFPNCSRRQSVVTNATKN